MTQESPKYWRSFEELEQTPEFKEGLKKEFLNPPSREKAFTEMERRDFLKAMGASLLLATTACYRRPVEKIIPYVNRPEEIVPGVADWYTSACGECSVGCGILVKTREGRPIKVEGNESHPINQGGLCARGQASILNLYDPDRLKAPLALEKGSPKELSWEDFDQKTQAALAETRTQGKKVALLTGAVNSPSTLKLIGEFLKAYPGAMHAAYEGVVPEEIGIAQELCYGEKVTPRYRFDKAKLILSFGADFLGTWLSPVEFAKQFSKARKVEEGAMARFIAVESTLTLTGTNADKRYAVKPGEELLVALCLANELKPSPELSSYDAESVSKQTGIPAEALRALAAELSKNKGQSLVVGGFKAKNGVALEVAVNLLNSILENDGVTVDSASAPSKQAESSYADLKNLLDAIKRDEIGFLAIDRSNPAYHLPVYLAFKETLKKVPMIVSFSDRVDETGILAHYIGPDSHPFETWNDVEPQEGLYTVAQPALQPMYKTRPFQESLMKWASLPGSWYEYLKNNWQDAILPKAGAGSWEDTLQKGFLQASGVNRDGSSGSRSVKSEAFKIFQGATPPSEELLLSLYTSVALFDGRAANNGWLQELPDPVSKITWDNYLSVSPKLAKRLSLEEGEVVRIQGKGVQAELPVHVQPGLQENSAQAAVGYGRIRAGKLGTLVGRNVYGFQRDSAHSPEWGGHPITLAKTGKRERLAATQSHNSFEGRPIILEMTLTEFEKKGKAHAEDEHPEKAHGAAPHGAPAVPGAHGGELPSMWSGFEYTGPYRWAMSIDMNACIGCNGCMVGCQSENNIPVVGKQQVLNGREMHWIRIDRYYSGDADQPEVSYQPMLCQHCENAPCETVCPVLATVHNDEGLNTQIYNRCVGTRYCSNNCPYKVRRFNFFDYSKQFKEPLNWALNPDLTVRTRGVMEKCTFCIQRITESKDKAKAQGRKVKDGELKTACQQSCPTDAIVFGNINDPESLISKMKKSSRGYHVLEDLNVKPQVTYLQKVRNRESV